MSQIELLDFYADWCGPCHVMEPVLEEIEKEVGDKVKITKIDVDSNLEEVNKYGVMSMPTFVVLKDGKEAARLIGVQAKEKLLEQLK